MAAFTPAELATIAYTVQDYAGNYYGPQPHLRVTWSRWDSERYVTEGHLKGLIAVYSRHGRHTTDEVWAAVSEYLDAHPEILAAGRITDEQRAERQAARDAAAQALLDEAEVPFREGRWDDALALIDQAELESPGYAPRGLTLWDRYREVIDRKRREAAESPQTGQLLYGHGRDHDR